jgi:hypothetical protein
MFNGNSCEKQEQDEGEEVLILKEAVAEHAWDIHANECDGC